MLSFCIQQKSQVAFLPFGCMRSDLNGLLSVSHTSTTEKKIACYWKKRIYSCRFHCCSCWYSSCSLFFSSLNKHFSLTLRHTQRYAKGMQCMTYETFFSSFSSVGRCSSSFLGSLSYMVPYCVCRFQIAQIHGTHRIILRALIFGVPFWANFFVGLCDNFAKSFLFRLISFSLLHVVAGLFSIYNICCLCREFFTRAFFSFFFQKFLCIVRAKTLS